MTDVATDTTEFARQLEAVSRVSRAVASARGLQPVLDEVVAASTQLCEGGYGALFLLRDDLLQAVASYETPDAPKAGETFEYDKSHPHGVDQTTFAGRASLTREVVHIPDIEADSAYTYSGPRRGFRSGLGVPIVFEDNVIGAMALVRDMVGPFTDEQIALVKTFADQAAIAIANARLIDTVQRQLDQQRAISDVLASVARAEGLESVLRALVEAAARLCDAQFGEVHLIEGDLLRMAVGHGGPPELYEYEREHPHPATGDRRSVNGRVLLTREVVHIPDIREDPEYSWPAADEAGIRALLGAPLLVEGELVGVFNIVRTEAVPYTDEQIELLRTFADQAAIAVANARLLETTERQLQQQRVVGEALRVVARGGGLQGVLDEVIESATRLTEGEYGVLALAEGDLLRVFAHHGKPELAEHDWGKTHARDRTSVIGRVALEGRPVQIADVLADPEYSWSGQQIAGYRALLGVPILHEEELIGAMGIMRDVPGQYSAAQVELVETFADQAAIAIANARLLEAVERQRTELARFVSPQVAELVSTDEGEKLLAGHRAYISCLFCDLRGSTAFSEAAEPEEMFEVLGEYHRLVGELIPGYGGTLEHFAGDGLMVFFNDPLPVEEHELKAVRLAHTVQERFGEVAEVWRKRGTELGLGIGIAAGYATIGRIGFEGRYDYGVLGPVANLAARLSSEAKAGQTLISQRIYAAVEEEVEAERVGELELKGFREPVPAYGVRGLRG